MKIALVTGTTRGIGLALARELVERGWRVLGLARGETPDDLELAATYAHGQVDLASLADLERRVADLAERHRFAKAEHFALVNNAGVLAPVHPVAGIDLGELERAYRVNVAAPTWLMGFVLAQRPRGSTTILNLSSGAATKAYPGWAAYCGTKAALRMAGQVLAAEIEASATGPTPERRLAVVSYAPHVVATRMQAELRATSEELFPLRQRFIDLHESGELVAPEGPAREMAELCERSDLPVWTETRYEPPR